MRRSTLLVVICICVLANLATAETPGGTGEAVKVKQLISRLHSARFREREAASAELEVLGEAALRMLKQSAADPDPEVASRSAALVERITARVETARRLKPTLVHLRLDNVTVEGAVAELARQSGYPLAVTGGQTTAPDRRVSLDTGRVPFWTALHQLCEAAELHEVTQLPRENPTTGVEPGFRGRNLGTADVDPRTRALQLAHGRAPTVPSHVEGALRVRVATAAQPPVPPEDAVAVLVCVDAEPRLMVEAVFAVRVDKAVDERGRPVAALPAAEPTAPNEEDMVLMRRAAVLRARGITYRPARMSPYGPGATVVHFPKTEVKPADLRECSGAAGVTLRTAEEDLAVLEKPLEANPGSSVRCKDVQLTVQQVGKREDGGYDLAVDVRHALEVHAGPRRAFGTPTGRAAQFGQVTVQEGSPSDESGGFYGLALLDKAGRAVPTAGPRRLQMRMDGDCQMLTYTLSVRPRDGDHGAPERLVFRGTRSVSVEVPFTLNGVPLRPPVMAR